jgi:hypothetical protein
MPADDQSAVMTDEQRSSWFEAQAEEAYDKMYDAIHSTDAAARYSDAKEAMRDRDRSRASARGGACPHEGGVPVAVLLIALRLSGVTPSILGPKPGADFTKS